MKNPFKINSVFFKYVWLWICIIMLMFVSVSSGNAQESENISNSAENIDDFVDPDDLMGMYVIDTLDRLLIIVYAGEKQIEEYQKFVNSDSTVYLPFLESDVKVGGLMVMEVESKIEKLARSFIKEPRIVINVLSSSSNIVSTYGKISNQTVEFKKSIRILQLLARVGGTQEGARADSIRVISIDGSIRYFNYKEVNENPTDENNFFLRPGDIIFVPSEDDFSVMVLGDVGTAGSFPLKEGANLLDAILKAGSWNTGADIKNVRVVRIGDRKKAEVKKVNLKKFFDKGNLTFNFALQDGDIIFIPRSRTLLIIQLTSSVLSILYTVITSYAIFHSLKD